MDSDSVDSADLHPQKLPEGGVHGIQDTAPGRQQSIRQRGLATPAKVPESSRPATFNVRLPGPLDVAKSLQIFRRGGDDLLDRWNGVRLLRTLQVPSGAVAFACVPVGTLEQPSLQVTVETPEFIDVVESAVRASFVVAPPEYADLLKIDPIVARLEAAFPGLRPVRQLDLLTALIRCISSQQVNLNWAATMRRRLAEAFGERHLVDGEVVYSLSAERLASADRAEIRALQFTSRKAECIVRVAEAVASGRLTLEGLAALPDEEVISRLTAIRGIGLWTAEWVLARTLGRPRVVAGDLGVRRAVGHAYLGRATPSENEVRAATAHWGRAAGVAQQLLLNGYVCGALGA